MHMPCEYLANGNGIISQKYVFSTSETYIITIYLYQIPNSAMSH